MSQFGVAQKLSLYPTATFHLIAQQTGAVAVVFPGVAHGCVNRVVPINLVGHAGGRPWRDPGYVKGVAVRDVEDVPCPVVVDAWVHAFGARLHCSSPSHSAGAESCQRWPLAIL